MKNRFLCLLLAAVMIVSLCLPGVTVASAASSLKASEKCVEMIKSIEGFVSKPTYDYGQYSIGYGTSCKFGDYSNGITKAEADKLLREDLAEIETVLNKFADKFSLKLSQQQFDALVSFTYNLGSNWMYNESTFRSAVVDGAKGNDFIFAITMWCNAGNSILPGLVQRRQAEANLYLNGVYSDEAPANYRYVIFDTNIEDAVNKIKIQGYDANQTDKLRSSPTKAGYRFMGWYTQPVGGAWIETVDGSTTATTLYAHWQSVDDPNFEGTEASYVRYAGENQYYYDDQNGHQLKLLTPGTKLTIIADFVDNNGVKWGKLSGGTWIKLSETENAQTTAQGEAVNLTVTVNTDDVNIRTGPGTSYPKAGKANKGQQLQLTRVQQGGMYLWGQFSGGWICLDYTDYDRVSLENSEDADTVTATGTVVNADKLNIRAYPGTDSAKVGQYSKGDRVTITQQQRVGSTMWGKTDKGWISLYYVQLDEVETEDSESAEDSKQPEQSESEAKDEVIATGRVVGCTTLRVRAGAGTSFVRVRYLKENEQVNIYEMKVVGSQIWGRIENGWISMTYVKLDSADAETGGEANATVVDCTALNIRAGAGTSYARVGKYYPGDQVEILETVTVRKTLWGRTDKGWVSMDYIRLDSADTENNDTEQSGSGTEETQPAQPDNEDTSGSTGSESGETASGSLQTGVITGTAQLRVRSAPSASSEEVGTMKKGDRVVILETAKNGTATWGRTEKGWIHMYYVKLDSGTVPEGAVIRTVTTTLRIRAGAGTNYDAVGSYLRDTQVLILEQTTVNGTVWGRTDKGWISMYYVK